MVKRYEMEKEYSLDINIVPVEEHDGAFVHYEDYAELLEALQGIMSLFPVIEDDGTGRAGFTTETIQKLNTAHAAIAKALGNTK